MQIRRYSKQYRRINIGSQNEVRSGKAVAVLPLFNSIENCDSEYHSRRMRSILLIVAAERRFF